MNRSFSSLVILTGLLLATAIPSHAVVRAPRQMNFLEISAGYNQPWGEYNGVPTFEFIDGGRHYEVDADDLYSAGPSFGIHYGRIAQGRLAMAIGFRYTHPVLEETVDLSAERYLDFRDFDVNLYEGDINFNYYLANLNTSPFAPYVGVGVQAGIASFSAEGYDSRNDFSSALSLNFGLDLTLYRSANDGSFMTLASINSLNVLASNDRPKNLTIGGGLRYYFRL